MYKLYWRFETVQYYNSKIIIKCVFDVNLGKSLWTAAHISKLHIIIIHGNVIWILYNFVQETLNFVRTKRYIWIYIKNKSRDS